MMSLLTFSYILNRYILVSCEKGEGEDTDLEQDPGPETKQLRIRANTEPENCFWRCNICDSMIKNEVGYDHWYLGGDAESWRGEDGHHGHNRAHW